MKHQIRRAVSGPLSVLFLSGIFAATTAADGVTHAEASNSALYGSQQGPPAVTGSVSGNAVNSDSGTSTATDGNAIQTWSAFASASATELNPVPAPQLPVQ